MTHGGRRKGAGRPRGSGRFDEPTRLVRIPDTLRPEVDRLLAEHAAKRTGVVPAKAGRQDAVTAPEHLIAGITVLPPIDALALMENYRRNHRRFDVVHLDPVYESNDAAGRQRFARKTIELIYAAAEISDHILCWGFPASLGLLVDRWPRNWRMEGWVTWHFQNAPTRARGWRAAQNACLHLVSQNATTHPENFYSDSQLDLAASGRLAFKPGPPNVVVSPMISGFALRSESVGFRGGQKPVAVIEHVLKMCLPASGGHVLDPTCGAGTTGIAARNLIAYATLSDRSTAALRTTRKRLLQSAPT